VKAELMMLFRCHCRRHRHNDYDDDLTQTAFELLNFTNEVRIWKKTNLTSLIIMRHHY